MAGNAGVVGAGAEALGKMKDDGEVCAVVLKLLLLLITDNEMNRDRLKEPLSHPGIASIAECLKALPGDAAVQEAGFRLTKTAAIKSESIKASFMEYDGLAPMKAALEQHVDNAEIVKNVGATMRTVTNADDWSTKVSKVFDTSKDIAKGGLLPLVYAAMKRHEEDPEVLQELCGGLKGCAVQDDIVKAMLNEGGLAGAIKALRTHMNHPGLASRCMLLFSNLAENDDAKKVLCQGEALGLMLQTMQLHQRSARVMRAGFTALASMALRMPDNVEVMMEAGAARVVVEGMKAHTGQQELNRQAMICVRNMVVRCPHHREAFLADGVEELIVAARDTHIKCADAAFDCLRDLGCEYGGLGDLAGKGKHSAYVGSDDSLVQNKAGQANAGSSMVTWEEEEES
uniref:Protein HGH1 homolog n=3 Tax=Hemiselmis andersenii TaxID=464988 RepID=A0A7S1GVK0_HEMAN|mmetsp:Transcript_18881/g.45416  ORF Transcript_18881/g.45416 Transcript_18881/m.45416 type:complete len:400 (+) Transcript_18881:115-1314(+)